MGKVRIRETPRPLKENIASVEPGKVKIRIIEGDRWGSSGYYLSEVLKRDGAKAFPKGTHMYLNHPSESEEWDRPERDLRDLVGVLQEDASYNKDGLYAEASIYPSWAGAIKEMADDIGISIRAVAKGEEGVIEGRKGLVFSELVEGISVDYVTKAGAGGKVVQVIESAREAAKEATTNNRRAQLERAIADTYGDAWVNDFDESENTVYFTNWIDGVGSRQYAQTFEPAADDNSVSLTGERWEVMRQTNWVAVPPAPPIPEPVSEDDNPERPDPEEREATVAEVKIQESELQGLRESAKRAETLETQLTEAKDEGRKSAIQAAKESRRANREQARRIVGEMFHEAGVKAPSLAKHLSVDPPLIEEGKDGEGTVDEDKLKEQAKEAIDEIVVEADGGSGGVRGFGSGKPGEDEDISEADLDKLAGWAFDREEVKG